LARWILGTLNVGSRGERVADFLAVLQRLQTPAGKLIVLEEFRMSQPDLRNEINAAAEPLLPIEKKLIGWSLGIGIALLIVLIAVNHFVPIKL
jgi:hypothetical protein